MFNALGAFASRFLGASDCASGDTCACSLRLCIGVVMPETKQETLEDETPRPHALTKLLLTVATGDSAHFRPMAARGGRLCAAVLQVESRWHKTSLEKPSLQSPMSIICRYAWGGEAIRYFVAASSDVQETTRQVVICGQANWECVVAGPLLSVCTSGRFRSRVAKSPANSEHLLT